VRNLPLLFGCLKKFRSIVIPQAPLENFQDFGR
jgi:hypothetical protein